MRTWVVALGFSLVSSCSALSCETPLEREQRELREAAEGFEAVVYRGFKVSIRSAPIEDLRAANAGNVAADDSAADDSATDDPGARVRQQTGRLTRALLHAGDEQRREKLEAADYVELAASFYKLRNELREVDEDTYPTLFEQMAAADGSLQDPSTVAILTWYNSAWEHLLLAAVWAASQKAPRGFVLYETGKMDPNELQSASVRMLMRSVRGMAFLQYGWPYMSEIEMTAYLDELATNREAIIAFSRNSARGRERSDEQLYAQWHAIGVLLRGGARMNKGDEFEEEALSDLELFLKDAETLGLDEEIVWLIAAYVGIKRDDAERAVPALRKLSQSALFPEAEQQLFSDAANAVEQRDPDAALASLNDKVLFTKVVGAYVFRILMRVNWREKLEATEAGRAVLRVEGVLDEEAARIKQAMSAEQLREVGGDALRSGQGWWDDAKRWAGWGAD